MADARNLTLDNALPNRQFRHDIFLSYATIDDQEEDPGVGKSKWVTNFVDCLQKRVNREVGGVVDIWRDIKSLEAQDHFEVILDHLTSSALFFMILSPAYLERSWTKRERIEFFRHAGGSSAARDRIFLIRTSNISDSDLPAEIQSMRGYHFFQKDCGDRLGYPYDDTISEYYRQLHVVALDAGRKIKQINRIRNRNHDRYVFVAQSSQGVRSEQASLEAFLQDRPLEYGVLPNGYYDHDPNAFRQVVVSDLPKCTLFIQLLSEEPSELDRLQWEVAKDLPIKKMRWHRKDLNINNVADPGHREFLTAGDIQRMDFEEFKSSIWSELTKAAQKKSLPSPSSSRFVLIQHRACDAEVAERVSGKLSNYGIANELLRNEQSTPFERSVLSADYTGFVIAIGQGSDEWARYQLRSLRRIAVDTPIPPPACGAYLDKGVVPPLRFEGLRILPEHFDEFLGDLATA